MSRMQQMFLVTALARVIDCHEGRRCWTKPDVYAREIERVFYKEKSLQPFKARRNKPSHSMALRGVYCRRSAQRLVTRGLLVQVARLPFAGYSLTFEGIRVAADLYNKSLEQQSDLHVVKA